MFCCSQVGRKIYSCSCNTKDKRSLTMHVSFWEEPLATPYVSTHIYNLATLLVRRGGRDRWTRCKQMNKTLLMHSPFGQHTVCDMQEHTANKGSTSKCRNAARLRINIRPRWPIFIFCSNRSSFRHFLKLYCRAEADVG